MRIRVPQHDVLALCSLSPPQRSFFKKIYCEPFIVESTFKKHANYTREREKRDLCGITCEDPALLAQIGHEAKEEKMAEKQDDTGR